MGRVMYFVITMQSSSANAPSPESMLKKKHAAINYHRTREAVAAGVIRIVKECTLRELISRILW
jgi:hypothetical protein